MKLSPLVSGRENKLWGYSFDCPGCEHAHVFLIPRRS